MSTNSALPMMLAGTVLSAAGQHQAGDAAASLGLAQQQSSVYSADVLGRQAGQTRAVAQQQAIIKGQDTAYALSTARARAAASGGGATDPTVLNIEGDIAGRGAYSALSALYTGEERARGLENQADLDIYTGEQQAEAGRYKQKAANIAAFSTILTNGGGLAARFGNPGGFKGSSAFGNISSDASNPFTYG